MVTRRTQSTKRTKTRKKSASVRRACILTAGGDAPGLNAVIRAFVKTCGSSGIEVYGSEDGFEGLICRAVAASWAVRTAPIRSHIRSATRAGASTWSTSRQR
jgi:6-phosphofructokinase